MVSVSGRGTSVSAPSVKRKLQNSFSPRMRATGSPASLREKRRLMLGDQRIDDLVERDTFHDLRQLVERQVDAVIGDAPCGKL
jgi:hypothetical protein